MAKKSALPEGTEAAPAPKAPKVFMDLAAFRNLGGEKFAGLNILKLSPGQAAGPLTVKEILKDQDLGTGKKGKKMDPVDVYVAIDPENIEVRLPLGVSLTEKLEKANVQPGDVIAIARGDDYTSKVYKTRGASYELVVISRANKSKK